MELRQIASVKVTKMKFTFSRFDDTKQKNTGSLCPLICNLKGNYNSIMVLTKKFPLSAVLLISLSFLLNRRVELEHKGERGTSCCSSCKFLKSATQLVVHLAMQ